MPETFQQFAELSADTILRITPEHLVTYASPSCLQLLGYSPEEMVGLVPPRDLIVAEDVPLLEQTIARSDEIESPSLRLAIRWRHKDGHIVWAELHASKATDPQTGELKEVLVILRDVSEQKAREEQLAGMALTDGLTGLGNRRAFDARINQEWQRTMHEGTPTSLLLIDLDHFKRLNDTYGHQVGDDCLRAAARTLTDNIRRGTDFAARYGGEELAVILPRMEHQEALVIAERICRAVQALRIPNRENNEGDGMLTVSIGVATALSRHGGSMRMPESLLLAADSALYKAKHNGRNRAMGALLLAPVA